MGAIRKEKKYEPKNGLELQGYVFLGRGPESSCEGPGWSTESHITYRCANCGTCMPANHMDYFSCECRAMHLDIDAARFGSNFGDHNILVYQIL